MKVSVVSGGHAIHDALGGIALCARTLKQPDDLGFKLLGFLDHLGEGVELVAVGARCLQEAARAFECRHTDMFSLDGV